MGHRSTFWIKMQFGIGHPPPTHQLQSTCVGEGSRVPNLQMEFNYLDSFKSYGIFSDFVVPMWSPSSLSSPRHPRVISIIPTSFPCHSHHPHCPQKVPMWSPWSVVSTCPRRPHIVPVIPVLSLSSPHHLEGHHIMPNPPDTHSTHPPPPWGGGEGSRISKNAIRFELIKIF